MPDPEEMAETQADLREAQARSTEQSVDYEEFTRLLQADVQPPPKE